MDVLSDVLGWLRVEGTMTRRSEFSAPWGIAYPTYNQAAFMFVKTGSCILRLDSGESLDLQAGDLVMSTPGHISQLADSPSTPVVPYEEVRRRATLLDSDDHAPERGSYPTLRYGGGGAATVIRAWGLLFEGSDTHPLFSVLPPFVHITYEERSALPWLETLLRFLMHETNEHAEGSDMMIARLADLLFVQVVRTWFHRQPEGQAGWLGALRDDAIRKALTLVHQQPATPWTVESLGRAVGMSRSSFSSRFKALVGVPPLRYLTQVRMHLAANALRADGRSSLAQIAAAVAYDQESSFSRAFKRQFGMSPGAYRRRVEPGRGPDQEFDGHLVRSSPRRLVSPGAAR